jgi:hypothetical protein
MILALNMVHLLLVYFPVFFDEKAHTLTLKFVDWGISFKRCRPLSVSICSISFSSMLLGWPLSTLSNQGRKEGGRENSDYQMQSSRGAVI